MNKQDQWIDDVLSSLKNVQETETNPHLHTRVMAKLNSSVARQPLNLKWVYAFTSIVLIMIVLNVFSWNSSLDTTPQTNDIETVVNDYNLENNYSSIY